MRSALISPLQAFTLAVQNHTQNEVMSSMGLESYELQPLVYSSLIQAGLDKLVFSSGTKLSANIPTHVASRIQTEDNLNYESCLDLASSILSDANRHNSGSSSSDRLPLLWGFVGDLLFALRTRRPIISFFDVPMHQHIAASLPPELSIPISNLLSQMVETKLNTGTPVVGASVLDVALCEEILKDEFYKVYAAKHAAIERTTDELDMLVTAIETDVRAMASRHRRLRIEKVGISTLNVSSKFIDKVLLGIPGKLGNELAAAAAGYLEDRQRVVVYKFSDIPSKVFAARMAYVNSTKANMGVSVLPSPCEPTSRMD